MVRYLFIFFLASGVAQGDPWSDAEALLQQQKPAEAVKILETAIAALKQPSGPQLYNFGTALALSGDHARAHGILQSACPLIRHDSDCKNNLEVVRSKLGEAGQFSPTNGFPLVGSLPIPLEWAWIGALLLSTVALFLQWQRSGPGLPGWLLVAAVFLTAAAIQWETSAWRGATTVLQSIRTGPAESFAETGQLPAGAWVSISEERNGWTKISFRRGSEKKDQAGWIPSTGLITTSGRP